MAQEQLSEVEAHLRIWLQSEGKMLIGGGRAKLLARVRELGSLHKAAAELEMSYRAAWGRIKRTEAALGQSLLRREPGRKGFVLTAYAESMIQGFLLWQAEVEAFAEKRAAELLPADLRPGSKR